MFDFFSLMIAIVALICRAQDIQPDRGAARAAGCAGSIAVLPATVLRRRRRRAATGADPTASPPAVPRRTATAAAPSRPPIPDARSHLARGRRRRRAAAAAATGRRPELRGAHRHPLGGLGRRSDAGARRLLHGALFDRGRPDRPRRARRCSAALFALALLGAGEWTAPQGKHLRRIAALPIANIPAILTAAGTAVAFATVYAAYALYGFLVPATAFILLGPGGAGHAGGGAAARAGAGRPRRRRALSSRRSWCLPTSRTSGRSTSISPSSPRRPSALARIRLWRWLAVTTIVFALLWTFPCLRMRTVDGRRRMSFHVIAGFRPRRAAGGVRLHVRPARRRRPDRADLFGLARGLSARRHADRAHSLHADAAMIVFALLVAGTLLVAWRAPAATGAVAAAAVLAPLCSWNGRCAPIRTCWWCRAAPLPGIGPHATDGSVSLHLTSAAIFAAGFGVAGFLAQGRSVSAIIPVVWSAAAVFTPLALLIALYARIAHLDRSIPFAILAVLLAAAFGAATEILDQARQPAGPADLDRAVCHRHAGRAGAGADLRARKRLAHDRDRADVGGTAWISMQRPIPFLRSLAAILAAIVVMRTVLRAAHRRRRRRHHADLQLAAVGLRRAGAVVLGRQHLPAPPRRRRAAARGRVGRDPVHGAAGVHGNPPCRQRRRYLSRYRRTRRGRRCRSARRSRWRSDWSGCGSAPAASFTMSAPSC